MAAKTPRAVMFQPPKASHCDFPDEPRTMHNSKMTGDEVGHLVSRLSKVNTARAMKCRLWSAERQDYERRREEDSVLKKRDPDDMKEFPKMYPEFYHQCDEEEMNDIVENVSKPTHSSNAHQKKTNTICSKSGVKKGGKSAWKPKPKSDEEREELTKRLLIGTAMYDQRRRDALFRRSKTDAYFVELQDNAYRPKKSFMRGGLKYSLET